MRVVKRAHSYVTESAGVGAVVQRCRFCGARRVLLADGAERFESSTGEARALEPGCVPQFSAGQQGAAA